MSKNTTKVTGMEVAEALYKKEIRPDGRKLLAVLCCSRNLG